MYVLFFQVQKNEVISSFIGLGGIFFSSLKKKILNCSNIYRSALILINARMNAHRHMCSSRIDEHSLESYIGRDGFFLVFSRKSF